MAYYNINLTVCRKSPGVYSIDIFNIREVEFLLLGENPFYCYLGYISIILGEKKEVIILIKIIKLLELIINSLIIYIFLSDWALLYINYNNSRQFSI